MGKLMNKSTIENIELELCRIEEDADHTSRSCFEICTRWSNFFLWLGIPATVLAAISGAISAYGAEYSSLLATIFSIMIAILTGLQTFLNPQDTSNNYRQIGNKYLELRNKARIVRTIDLTAQQFDEKSIIDKFNELAAARDNLNSECPHIPRWAYEKARNNIIKRETTHKVDLE